MYELDDLDRALMVKVRYAAEGIPSGEPLGDSLTEDDLIDAIQLLVKLSEEQA